ncbi:hypothetical protein [Candidatus Pantoea persica]|uniref:hypothetical protein n=1 Tax=Candidatus Pantoea persica TaxID=2518128 RepID=UPI00215D76E7|nr:hypothetical protein [Candidatus Pantoea persica]MBA2814027.1 ABC transporter ATPase [Candidatus Pantoea persica]
MVLMDEPFATLDPLTRLRLHHLTARLLQGKTVLLVTHDPLEACCMAHYIYLSICWRARRCAPAPLPCPTARRRAAWRMPQCCRRRACFFGS